MIVYLDFFLKSNIVILKHFLDKTKWYGIV